MDQNNTQHSKSEMSFDTTQIPIFSSGPCSASEHSVYLTYVCLVNHGVPSSSNADKNENPNNDTNAEEESNGDIVEPIQVERSKAVHELVESKKRAESSKPTTESSEASEESDQDEYKYDSPKVLKLTKMKWLSEDQSGYPDSSTPSVSSARSTTSSKAEDSDEDIVNHQNVGEKCLSTILRLDKEHNLFGMSSIAVIGSKPSRSTKQNRKDDEKPVFHQTAIVQVCCRRSCATACCRYKSNTDLPSSLRFSNCCFSTCTLCCTPPPPPPLPRPKCYSTCGTIRFKAPIVPAPTCAMIPRVPKIHVSCLPDSPPIKKQKCVSKCKSSCSPATDPLAYCTKCSSKCGAVSKPVGMCTISKDPVCRDCSQAPPPPFPCDAEYPCPMSCDPPCMQECTCGLTAFIPPEPSDCCYGLRLKLNRKPIYIPPPIEITPRCSSDLQKPLMARPCRHDPCCRPPSAGFPYLMPCYWPCRPSAPCLDPLTCFHHPPCLPPVRHKGKIPPDQICHKPCKNPDKNTDCVNKSCLATQIKFEYRRPEVKVRKQKNKIHCECDQPQCISCFVTKPKGYQRCTDQTTSGDNRQNSLR